MFVSGEVLDAGVYALPWDSRIETAIAAAGGFTAHADLVGLNLAQRLQDEQQVFVASKQAAAQATAPISTRGNVPTPTRIPSKTPTPVTSGLNLNTASAAELESLPGIGPVLAQRIIEYRAANGGFLRIEDIKQVKGIGDGIFQEIKGLIAVD